MRNTPAGAGKTGDRGSVTFHGKKHPRVGGEEETDGEIIVRLEETPPRRRGRDAEKLPAPNFAGNTPA